MPARPRQPDAEHGAVLILALVFMTLLMLLGGGAVSTVVLEERMAAGMRDQNLSFQAAEATLARAEMVLAATAVLEDIGGAYPLNSERKPPGDPGRVTYWTKGDFKWNPRFAAPVSILLSGVETTAYYVIEQLPTPSDPFSDGPSEAFRITVRATGGSSDAVTILQATYTR